MDCTARDVNGDPVAQQLLPPSRGAGDLPPGNGGYDCLEAFLMSNQVGDNSVADHNGPDHTGNGQLVNGNYGFTAGCLVDPNAFPPVPGSADPVTGDCITGTSTELPQWDYIVEPQPPNDAFGRPLFKPVKEEDINVFTGDEFVAPGETPVSPPTPVQPNANNPQPTPQVPPFICAGALHTVDVASTDGIHNLPDGPNAVSNPGFADTVADSPAGANASPYEGQQKPLCNARMVTVQRGKSATAATKLVIVYPGAQGTFNPFGAYFENIVIRSPVKLQGVGPGGVYPDGTQVRGSVLDGTGFGTDNAKSTAWETLVGGLTFQQPPTPPEFMPYGEVVLVVSQTGPNRPFGTTAATRASIDGITIQGGDVANAPPNLNDNGGGTELALFEPLDPFFQAGVSQGGGIFAYASTPNLQITNNILTNNGGAYGGAIRLGTPYAGDNSLDGIHIVNNQIVANSGSNLAGAVGIFAGTDNYEVDHNNVCGNFSAEYGGGISHFGLSLFGKIHDNRIYFNGSYDEGAGVIIAGELPLPQDRQSDPTSPLPPPPAGMSPGAGPVDIYNNVIQSNLSGDDGGGLRYLLANNFTFNTYNNIIANNISTHEGGGVALDDAPNVRLYNNTVVKNITTATSVSSNGLPATAGMSTMQNSDLLQTTLPGGAPLFSDPLQFNNVFCDNRAGRWDGANVIGIGGTNVVGAPDPNPINYWDLGADGLFDQHPTNSILQPQPQPQNPGIDPALYPPSGSNQTCPSDLTTLFKSLYDTSMLAFPWRGDAHFVGNVIIAQDVPPSIMGDYHLLNASTIANDAGVGSKNGTSAPAADIDGDARSPASPEIGADEIPSISANLSITKTDNQTVAISGSTVTYLITVSKNASPAVSGATVADIFPAALTNVTWTCTASSGASCGAASGSGNINTTVNLPAGGGPGATFTASGTLAASAVGSLSNTASVAPPPGVIDPVPSNNSATDSDTIVVVPALPALGLLDNFDGANANTLGSNWSQVVVLGASAIRVNSNQAFDSLLPGQAIWNVPAAGFGARQGAAFTFATAPVNNSSLILKATGGASPALPLNFIRVLYQSGQVVVATTTNGGLSYTTRATFPASFAAADTLSAVAYSDGTVNVYKTSGSTTTPVATVTIPTSGTGAWTQGTGGGRVGMQLPANARVDSFSGGTLP